MSGVPELLYYSHIPATVLALLVGFFVYFSDRKRLLNKLLLLISLCFCAWTIASLLAWTNIHADFLAATWSIFAISAALISILSIYFVYVFLEKRDISLGTKVAFLILLLPVLLFSHTDLNISGFNLANCDAFDHEGLYFKSYYNALGFISIIWIFALLVRGFKKADSFMRKQILLMGIGMELFLISFITTTFTVSYLVNKGILSDSRLEMYSLFGMVIFMTMLSILIVKFNTFKVGVLATQALLVALTILVGSQLTFATTKFSMLLTGITLILTLILGFLLNRSVKKEIKQKEQLQLVNEKLEHANDRLRVLDKQKSEFVSIASHQLRSPLTAIRGYVSLIEEGSFGPVSDKMKDALHRISESGKFMAVSIDDFLNVSRIESGNMKYEYKDINLREQAEHIVEDLRSDAIKRGLLLLFKTDLTGKGIVNADFGKTQQILHNLINNALKYTRQGSVTVFVHDDPVKKIINVEFIDTGIGMSAETLEKLFGKFARAKVASSANIMGTGLGLFVARAMARAMKGDVTAHSDGEGKGSRFVLTLPYVM